MKPALFLLPLAFLTTQALAVCPKGQVEKITTIKKGNGTQIVRTCVPKLIGGNRPSSCQAAACVDKGIDRVSNPIDVNPAAQRALDAAKLNAAKLDNAKLN